MRTAHNRIMFEMNFENFETTKNATATGSELLLIGEPRQYRADCKSGQFKIGKNDMVGKTLVIEPIAAKLTEDQLFSYERQKWAELLFVDKHGIVSTILFKGESLRNFIEIYRKAVVSGQLMNALQLCAEMSSRSNSYGEFFAVEFEIAGAGKFAEQIKSLVTDKIAGMFRLDSLPRGKNGNEEPEETTAVATTTRTIKRR